VTSSPQPTTPGFDWEVAGREVGASLDELHAVAVLGTDHVQTAKVALGIARQQARYRRVALGDLLGDAAPITELLASDDPHGIADVFEYGVSVDKVVQSVATEKNLFILPSGTALSDLDAIVANRKWTRLANGFREESGLLIVAANASAPNVESLVLQLDGAVLVGDLVPARLPMARVLGTVRDQRAKPAPAPPARARPKYAVRAQRSMWKIGASVGLVITAIIAALSIWLAARPYAESPWAPDWIRNRGKRVAAPTIIRGLDTAGVAGVDTTLPTARHLGLLTAQDSALQAPFGIALVTFNTQAGALLELQRNGTTLRAGTFTPVLIRETPWFRVVAGAYPDSASAAALLDTLRARGTSDAGRAVIERFPYALLVERDVPDSAIGTRLAVFQSRGLPVYALLQTDGTARLYAGAFKAPAEATLLFDAMKTSGVPTSLVYRTGRVY